MGHGRGQTTVGAGLGLGGQGMGKYWVLTGHLPQRAPRFGGNNENQRRGVFRGTSKLSKKGTAYHIQETEDGRLWVAGGQDDGVGNGKNHR
ncbi:uncharacterized protein LOC144313073 isoform X2 [Canis aureus]